MGQNSHIEWCDHTFNPWEGCTKVSPGCANCYAETRNARFGGGTAPNWGKGAPRRRTSVHNWNEPRRWNKKASDRVCSKGHSYPATYANLLYGKCYQCGERWENMPWHRPRVFCASLADWLDDEVPIEWLADLLDLIRLTPNLDWLLLTKRPENWRPRLDRVYIFCTQQVTNYNPELQLWVLKWLQGEAPTNVWIGTTVEDQQRADERIPQLLRIPARVRFLSCEPLLGPVDLTRWLVPTGIHCMDICPDEELVDRKTIETVKQGDEIRPRCPHCGLVAEWTGYKETGIHWVICGGESGPKARPMHPNWARSLRDQCQAAGVPFFFKQWGEHSVEFRPGVEVVLDTLAPNQAVAYGDGKTNHVLYTRVGKKAAGALLDGREWKEFPEVKP